MEEQVNQQVVSIIVSEGKGAAAAVLKAVEAVIKNSDDLMLPSGIGEKTTEVDISELLKSNGSISEIDIKNNKDLNAFRSTLKKYGIKFSVLQDEAKSPPEYKVFFQGKDAAVMKMAFKEFMDKQVLKEKKPSIIENIKKQKQKVEILKNMREKLKNIVKSR